MQSRPSTLEKKDAIHIDLENSFIMLSHVNPSFWKKMKEILDEFQKEADWFQATTLAPHLTIAFSDQIKEQNLTKEEIEKIKQESSQKISALLDANVKKPIFLLPTEISVAANGWILLDFAEFSLQEKDGLLLKKLHHLTVDLLETKEFKQRFKHPQFIRDGFKAHVSLGKIIKDKFDLGLVTKEFKDSGKKAALLQKISKTVPPLNLSEFDFINNLSPKTPLVHKKVPKQNFNVISAIRENKDNITIEFKDAESASSCAKFLYTFGIYSSGENPIAPECKNSIFGITLTHDDYNILPELIDNCKSKDDLIISDPPSQKRKL